MLALLFVALADTVIAPVNADMVLVHEWGVVEIDTYTSLASGAPAGPQLPIYYDIDYCVEAPVVWFHGADFTGLLTVDAPRGHLTVTYPEPDRTVTDQTGMPIRANWALEGHAAPVEEQIPITSEGIPETAEEIVEESMPEMPNTHFDWAMDLWRAVPSLGLTGTDTGWSESFVYYESQVDNLFGLPPDGADLNWLVRDLDVPAMIFYSGPEAYSLMCPAQIAGELPSPSTGDFVSYERTALLETLCSWGGGGFKSEEITALIDTWESKLTTVPYGQTVVLFPIPSEYYDSISTLSLETDQGFEVSYNRLFLGLIVLSTSSEDV